MTFSSVIFNGREYIVIRWYFCAVALFLTTFLLCTGCDGPKDQLATAKVDGNVSYQGAAIESGTITFFPVAGGKHATGMIAKEGAFTLSTYETGDGAVLGKHKVVINVSYERPDGIPVPDSVLRVPAKYSSLKTTTLTAEVTLDGENSFPFVLMP